MRTVTMKVDHNALVDLLMSKAGAAEAVGEAIIAVITSPQTEEDRAKYAENLSAELVEKTTNQMVDLLKQCGIDVVSNVEEVEATQTIN
jgi:hypothetical protein